MPPSPALRGTFRTDLPARAAYAEGAGIYRILPSAIAVPADVPDLVRLVEWAGAEGASLVPRGAGSGMAGGNVGDGIVVDLTRIGGGSVAIDPIRRVARAAAGATHLALNRAAGDHGLRLPPDPSSGRFATLGGMLSTNAAGARTVRYGSVRRWVQAAEVVTADGDVVRLERGAPSADARAVRRFLADAAPAIRAAAPAVAGAMPKTRKNSSGYAIDAWLGSDDLVDLLIGAEGTLGFVTATEWRLDRHPAATAALRVSLASLDELAAAVEALLAHEPSAVELLDRTFLELVQGRAAGPGAVEAVLLVELESSDAGAMAAAVRAAAADVAPFATSVETALSPAEADRLWALRHAASPILAGLPESRRSLQVIEDGCVPLPHLGEYVRELRGAARERGIEIVLFGHAGDGHLHCNLLPDVTRAGWESEVAALLAEMTAVVTSLGGTPSGEHGDGRLRAPYLEQVFGRDVVALFGLVKAAFDPRGILNPGVKLGSAPAVDRLKVGARAVPLPPPIAAALRELERAAAYDTPRLELLDTPVP
ncbi:MAG TPA: FAD-binding oxidoreductase [Gemmatimonadales bacterium]